MKFKFLLIPLIILFIGGCATRLPQELVQRSTAPASAKRFYQELDHHLDKDGVVSSLGNKITGFPYLRTNRFYTHLKTRLDTDQNKKDWIRHLMAYDLMARSADINALSKKTFSDFKQTLNLPADTSRDEVIEILKQSAGQLHDHDQTHPAYHTSVIEKTHSPDEYSFAYRMFGFYPLAYTPVIYFSEKSHDTMVERFQTPKDKLPVRGTLVPYMPQASLKIHFSDIRYIFTRTPKDSLGISYFTPDDQTALLHFFAPGFLIDVADEYDRPGKMVLTDQKPQIETATPVIYYYFSHALLKDRPVVQINYSIWFPARDGPAVPWYEKGNIDGLTIRVSLDETGAPFMIDIVHNCACYHFFAPDKDRIKAIKPMAAEFGNQVPTWMPEDFPENRLMVRVSSGWHQVQHIATLNSHNKFQSYELIPYADLESLKIFKSNGVIKETSRWEPLFLFPMGIPDIGAMRQRTHHPTRLLGREHFDNPQLFNNFFEFK